ncbi:MAG: xylulokinase [Acidimicrobiia bacterium]|nr:xylulokinase [Acidimicrobiia bacterium]
MGLNRRRGRGVPGRRAATLTSSLQKERKLPLVAGVDASTQSTKVVVVDAHTGMVAAEGRAPHVVTGAGGARETDPEGWWQALRDALAQTGRAADIAAISVAGQQHGLVVLDGSGRPLRPAKLWNDIESAGDARQLTAALGGPDWWAERIGLVPVASFTATKWAWLRRVEPQIAAATRAIRLPHDFLTERLTGSGVTDRSDASGTAWWSTATEDYADEVLSHASQQLDRALLPRVLGPHHPAGEVTTAAAAYLGLRAGIPVGPGSGDNAGAAVGLGLEPGTPAISLGTSGTAFMSSAGRVVDPSGDVAGFADATGRFLPLACTLNCTLAVDRFAAWLGLERDAAARRTGVVVLPYLDGERTPNLPNAAASILGLRHATEPGEILLAAYQGAVLSLLEALEVIDARSSGIDPAAPIVLIGGGARGATWRRVVRELSGRPVQVPEATELVALGGAAQAAAVLGGEAPEVVARKWDTRRGILLDPVERDTAALGLIKETRARLAGLNA